MQYMYVFLSRKNFKEIMTSIFKQRLNMQKLNSYNLNKNQL